MDNRTIRHQPSARWSNRILILAAIGIFFLTLYPFRFSFRPSQSALRSPFLLGAAGKNLGVLDDLLNLLLFVPLGFGLADFVHRRGLSRAATLTVSLAVGAAASYGVEFLQLYLPPRDAGWRDVLTNTAGSVVGAALFFVCGIVLLRLLSRVEAWIHTVFTPPRVAVAFLLYFGCWFAVSFPLQRQTRLTGWSPDSLLVIGSGAAGRAGGAWRGKVSRLELWDRALSEREAVALTSEKSTGDPSLAPLASYSFSGEAPFRDQRKILPELFGASAKPDDSEFELGATSRLASRSPFSAFASAVQRTNRFAIRMICTPDENRGRIPRILSISRSAGGGDVTLLQDNADLGLWFRNAVTARRPTVAWWVKDAFVPGRRADLLYSFDGADLSLYVNGIREGSSYHLGAGAALASYVRNLKPPELEGYEYVFCALVFFPAGILLGIAARRINLRHLLAWFALASGSIMPPWLFEHFLAWAGARPYRLETVILSAALVVAGALWWNADGASKPDAA